MWASCTASLPPSSSPLPRLLPSPVQPRGFDVSSDASEGGRHEIQQSYIQRGLRHVASGFLKRVFILSMKQKQTKNKWNSAAGRNGRFYRSFLILNTAESE